jgi:hypothetical protein
MTKEEQTSDVIEKLYFLTRTWVRKEWRNFFYQFDGDVDDLASDYFMSFMTAKSRTPGQEKTFLDTFDPTVRTIEGYTRCCVVRKLIDSSRVRSHQYGKCDKVSLSGMIDANAGNDDQEIIDPAWEEMSVLPDVFEHENYSWEDIRDIKQHFYNLSEHRQAKLKEQAIQFDADLSPEFKEMFSEVITRNKENKLLVD